MRRLADPRHCPSCTSLLRGGSLLCPACGVDLSGPVAHELFVTLTRADALLDQLRAGTRTAPAPAAQPLPGQGGPTASPPARRAASVPQLLLGLGAVCLLVAALVFLAVSWSRLGVGGRTAVLVGFTVAGAGLTAWSARRGLRGATEALGLVTAGLGVLDLLGADSAHWLGDPSAATMTGLVGGALVGAGLLATAVIARTAVRGFTTGEVAAALGAALLSTGLAAQEWGSPSARLVTVVCLVAALTSGVVRLRRAGEGAFRVASWLLVPVLALDWLALVGAGLDALGLEPTMASAWGRLDAWPLVVAAALALAPAAWGRTAQPLRIAAAAAGLVPLGLAVLAPLGDESTTAVALGVAAVAVPVAALMVLAPRPWGVTGSAVAALCGLTLGAIAAALGTDVLGQYARTAAAGWGGEVDGQLERVASSGDTAAWLLPVCVAVLSVLAWATLRLLDAGRATSLRADAAAIAGATGAAGVASLLLLPVPVWSVLLAAAALGLALAVPALARDDAASAVLATGWLLGTVVLSWYDEVLTAATVLVAVGSVAAIHLRTRRPEVAAGSASVATGLLAGLVWTSGAVLDAPGTSTALVGLLLTVALLFAEVPRPDRTLLEKARVAREVAAACAAVALASAGLDSAAAGERATWLAIYLTISGAGVVLLALLRPDRRPMAWLGGLLLATATWVRLSDLGVTEPEPYTLPSALVLIGVGLVRLLRDRSATTHLTLGAGLALALVPSLLWVLEDPTGLRPLLLGLTCLVLVVLGVQLGWLAPLLHGAAVGVLVVLREAGPAIGDSVPRWGLIGAAGALLIALGVTWEQRLRDARLLSAYVRGLR